MEKLTGRLRTRPGWFGIAGLYIAAVLGGVALTIPALNSCILANCPLFAVTAIVAVSMTAEGCRRA